MARAMQGRDPEGDGAAVREDLEALFSAELARSRRHDRPLAVVVLHACSVGGPSAQGRGRLRDRSQLRRAARAARDLARRYDVVSPDPARGAVVVVAPQDGAGARDADGGAELARRLGEVTGLPAGSACFPDDGVTLEHLLAVASRRARTRRVSRPVHLPTTPTTPTRTPADREP